MQSIQKGRKDISDSVEAATIVCACLLVCVCVCMCVCVRVPVRTLTIIMLNAFLLRLFILSSDGLLPLVSQLRMQGVESLHARLCVCV